MIIILIVKTLLTKGSANCLTIQPHNVQVQPISLFLLKLVMWEQGVDDRLLNRLFDFFESVELA